IKRDEKPAVAPAEKYNFTPAPRPTDVDEKLLKPEPGEVVSKHDYELNQAVAFMKTCNTSSTATTNYQRVLEKRPAERRAFCCTLAMPREERQHLIRYPASRIKPK